jgi:prephenate dehydrogenase
MRIGIIGGTGQMGGLFSGIFSRAGHEVRVSGRRTQITSLDLAKESDILLISVPIHATVPVIEEIIPHLQSRQVLCDLTSLKSEPVSAMLKGPAEVIGFHPMFGPTVASLQGQTIVATPARCSQENLEFFQKIFSDEGARVTVTTPEHHDRMMAVIQGLTHFKALVMAETMRLLKISPQDTEPFMSPVYRIETSIAGRILAQDPLLYADILTRNPEIPAVLETCQQAAASLNSVVRSGDIDAFSSRFIADREWFGEYCVQSLKETDRLITTMVGV